LRGAVLSFELINWLSMALAYGQVNASFCGVVSGDQSSSKRRLKNGQQVCSASNAPTLGHGERAKTLPTQND
jgi:hypothetical protein